jgi:type III pantothenate kinase
MEGKSVSDLYKALLVDIGNSQIKYAQVNNISDIEDVRYCHCPKDLTPVIQSVSQVLVSCVGLVAKVTELEDLCKGLNKRCHVIKTEAENLGIECAYENFQTLGVDRWLAILASREITQLPVAVIDLGTANTCDIVVGNKHLGGWISPGFSLMRESLLSNTQDVFADTKSPKFLTMGMTTQDCVSNGCLASQTGFVLMAEQFLVNRYDDYAMLITGGAQNLLSLPDNEKTAYFPNLVLRGLFRLV